MKTTIDIADRLFEQAKEEAHRQGTTFRDLVERGLTLVLRADAEPKPFTLRSASVDGHGAETWQALSADDRVALMYEE